MFMKDIPGDLLDYYPASCRSPIAFS